MYTYNVTPSNLQSNCNSCVISFNVWHPLSWCKLGLVITRHNKVHEKILHLPWKPSPHHPYAPNLLSIRDVPYHRRRSVRGETKIRRHWLISWYVPYGIGRLETSLTSNLGMLTGILTDMSQWQRSCIGGNKSKSTSMIITDKIKRKKFSVSYFSWWNAGKGSPGHTHKLEWTHGSKNWWTHYELVGLGKWSDHNRGCDIVLTNYPRSLTPQLPLVQEEGLGPGIGPHVGTINRVPE